KKFKLDQAYYPDQVYIKNSFRYPLTEEEKDQIKVEVKLTKLKQYRNNDQVGLVVVKLGDQEIHSQKVYVRVGNEKKKNIFSRIWTWLCD
ncbi:MAG: hypothetical protein PUB18_02445, partial [bacterium]|nr:hypothetical protein [bacterium]